MVDAAHFIGLVAGKAIPSPVPYADVVTFTTHKVLAGAARRHDPEQGRACRSHRQGGIPDDAGWTAHACGRGEGRGAERSGDTGVSRRMPAQVITNAQALTSALEAEGMRPVSGGTDTHLSLLDLRALDVTGTEAEARCDAARITLNKNAIPYDPQPPAVASGIRVGTPSVTTQGMGPDAMERIAALISRAVREPAASAEVAHQVSELVAQYPAYAPQPVTV